MEAHTRFVLGQYNDSEINKTNLRLYLGEESVNHAKVYGWHIQSRINAYWRSIFCYKIMEQRDSEAEKATLAKAALNHLSYYF